MHLEQRQTQRLEQRLALLPQMLQSIEVLQLATADLLTLIGEELQQNEVLEQRPAEAPEDAVLAPATPPVAEREDSGWDEAWSRRPAGGGDLDEDRHRAFLENQPAPPESLPAFVREQLVFSELPAALADTVVRLAEHLDERGLLVQDHGELARALGVASDELEDAIAVLQTLEPRGLGAASPIEAMLLQAVGDPDFAVIRALLTEHLEDLSRNRIPEVAGKLGLAIEELRLVLERMRRLSPRPAAGFMAPDARAIRPDAFVFLQDGEVRVALDDGSLPDLAVNAEYEALLQDKTTAREVRDWLRKKVRAARDLIGSISLRQHTLARVVAAVMQKQREFLANGPSAIKPLGMAEIAVALGLHASTVSRAIAGKYVQTDRGVFRLRDFFDGERIGGAMAAGAGRMAVGQQIQDLVAAEDKAAPLSDDAIVAALGARGIHVARRTVTKYRQELGIAGSYQRKRHGST
jgi:RNA polymerase sigma-54 factor